MSRPSCVKGIKQLVLAHFEFGNFGDQAFAIAPLHLGLSAYLFVLSLSEWGLGHESSQPSLVGLVGSLRHRFVRHPQVLAQSFEPASYIAQTPFNSRAHHRDDRPINDAATEPKIAGTEPKLRTTAGTSVVSNGAGSLAG